MCGIDNTIRRTVSLSLPENRIRTQNNPQQITQLRHFNKYETMREGLQEQSNRLHNIYRSDKAGDTNKKKKSLQAFSKHINIDNRMSQVDSLMRDNDFYLEIKEALPEAMLNKLINKYPDERNLKDQITSAFLFAYLKKDLRATRGRILNYFTATRGNTTSFKAIDKVAKELEIDSRLQNQLHRMIINPSMHWPFKEGSTHERTITVSPRLIFDDQRGKVGHVGTQIITQEQNDETHYYKVEGFGNGGSFWQGTNNQNRKFSPQIVGKKRTIELPSLKITPNQLKLLKYNLKDCQEQRYSLLKYNCSHTARQALRFAGINLQSRLKPKNLAQTAIKMHLQHIEKHNNKIQALLLREVDRGKLSINTEQGVEQKDKIREAVTERLKNEIQKLELMITKQKISRISIHTDRMQKKIDFLNSVKDKYSTNIGLLMENSRNGFKHAVKETLNNIKNDKSQRHVYEGHTKKFLEELWTPLNEIYS